MSQALTPAEITKTNLEHVLDRNLCYQPLKLSALMETRTKNNQSFLAIQQVNGLEPIHPEDDFCEGLFKNLIYEENSPTKCEFLIVVTMYNESAEHFSNTMMGVNDNLNEFYSAGIDPSKITCIMIVDGIKAFMETYNKQKGFFRQFFDEEMIKKTFQVNDVKDCKIPDQEEFDEFAHCFSQTTKFGNNAPPLNFIMCVKQFNKRKLNTHLWFFGGFCEMIQPKYVMLLDVGTKPLKGSLFYLYEAMVCDSQLAGCCGEIKPMDYNIWKIVVPAQVVEYKFAHMLDKALESITGYITVLPGAFSAYRWEALQGAPLWEDYFKSICHPELMDAFQSNIYLAEDRVLCLSLVSKKNKKYTLRYVKKSVAETDVPDSLAVLMAQRRRWVNGSWFALVDALKRFQKLYESKHHWFRKFIFTIQMCYYFLNVIYSWFMVGGFCLAFNVALRKNFDDYGNQIYGDAIILIYISILLIIFITSLGVKPKRVEDFYKVLSGILGIFQFYIIALMVYFVISGNLENHGEVVTLILGASFASFGLIVILNWELWTVMKGVLHYIFLIPTYVNIFLIYSICNVHDCTWGNRPDALNADEKERLEEFEEFRTRWTIIWALCNSGFAYGMGALDKQNNELSFNFFAIIAGLGIGILILRVGGGIIYVFVEACKKELDHNVNTPSYEITKRKTFKGKIIQSPGKFRGNVESEDFENEGLESNEEKIEEMGAGIGKIDEKSTNELQEETKLESKEEKRGRRKSGEKKHRRKKSRKEGSKRKKDKEADSDVSLITEKPSPEKPDEDNSRSIPIISQLSISNTKKRFSPGLDSLVQKLDSELKSPQS